MGHRLDNFQEFKLTFQSPWNLSADTTKRWSHSIYVTGTITHSDAEAEAAALDLAKPALALASSKTSLVEFSYYPSGQLVSQTVKIYTPGAHPGTRSAYGTTLGDLDQQLEVAAVAHCPIGKNTRGKEIYLRRYFHDVLALSSDVNALAPLADPSHLLDPYNVGSGPHAVTPCSPTSGHAGTGPWVIETHLFTHQLRRGKKKKKAQSLINELIDLGLDAADAASLAAKLVEAGAAKIIQKALG